MVRDDTIISAMGDAAQGQRVVVLTAHAAETDGIVKRAVRLAVDHLMRYAKATKAMAEAYVNIGSNPWQVTMKSGGWVFFYPEPQLKANDDIGNPSSIYVPNPNGRHDKMSYTKWRVMVAPPPIPIHLTNDPDQTTAPKTAWSHLMEDDE